jgi:hypothetical protein
LGRVGIATVAERPDMNTLGFIGNLGPWEWIIILVLGLSDRKR